MSNFNDGKEQGRCKGNEIARKRKKGNVAPPSARNGQTDGGQQEGHSDRARDRMKESGEAGIT